MNLNRVLALGKDTYLRLYPNPGFGVRVWRYRVAVSLWRGVEVFRRNERGEWRLLWRRANLKLSLKRWRD